MELLAEGTNKLQETFNVFLKSGIKIFSNSFSFVFMADSKYQEDRYICFCSPGTLAGTE